jgi:hypothetical protein
VLGHRRAEVVPAVVARQRGLEQVLEHPQLAQRGGPDVVGAREAVPRAGEREEARAAAVAVRREHRADAAGAVGVGADDDRVAADALEHRPPRVLGEAVDCGSQPADRVARRSHRADGRPAPRRRERLKGNLH